MPGSQVRDVQDHPSGQTGAGIPESLQVERNLEDSVEQARVAHYAHEEIVEEILNTFVYIILEIVIITYSLL